MYSNFGTYKAMYNNEIIPIKDIEIRRNKLIPETKISINQLNPINKVCPKSGCKINNKIIKDVNKKEVKNFIVKLDSFLFEIIKANMTIKKGFTNSTGCNLGKKIKSSHLVDPLTSTPIIGTRSNKIKDDKKI
jgi:hypothetical protein